MVLQERATPYTTDAYAGVNNPSSEVWIPIIQKGNSGNNSEIYIQNAGSLPTSLTLEFFQATSSSCPPPCFYSPGVTIAPGGRRGVAVSSITQLGSTFFGSVRITNSANQPLAVASPQVRNDTVSHMLEWSNTQPPAQILYAPLIQNNNNGIKAGLSLRAIGSGAFTIPYFSNGNICGTDSSPNPPNPWFLIQAPQTTDCTGLTILSSQLKVSSGLLVAGVNQVKTGGQASIYAGISQTGTVAYIPKYRWDSIAANSLGWKDGFTIMNPNSSTVKVTVTIYDGAGTAYSTTINEQEIAPNASLVVFGQFVIWGIPLPLTGSAVVVATKPVAVTVNSLYKVGNGDELGSYLATHR